MKDVAFSLATPADAPAIADLARQVADRLTRDFGKGHWSRAATEDGVRHAMEHGKFVVGNAGSDLVASLRLATKKPWSIDPTRFAAAGRPLYLLDMGVAPEHQRCGLGRRLLDEALLVARAWPGDAVRLDAYDTPAGAGPFYAKCGWEPRGRVVYRGTPLLYFERVLPPPDGA